MREKETRVCLCCGVDYTPRKKTNKYCGNDCAKEHRKQKSMEQVECKTCGLAFAARKSEKRSFCSLSCSASSNNVLYPKRQPENVCKIELCSSAISTNASYCSEHKATYRQIQKTQKINDWLSGDDPGGTKYGLSTVIRQYLLEQADYKCSKCGFNTPHPDDNKTILEINHINGDGTDHSKENLEVVCPNCHALTSNYRARNMGKGRPYYYIRMSKA